MKSKKFLSLMLAAVMALSLAAPAMAEEEAPSLEGSVIILHSNDVHGAIDGYAKMAAVKATYEAQGADVIVVDAGDYIQGEPTVSVSQGETAVELMNKVGYSLSALGNHEFDYGYENMKKLAESADFEILAANVLYEGKPAFGTNKVVEIGGKKIGFFGLSTPETATKAHPAKIQGVTFLAGDELAKCAQEQVDELKAAKVDVIVCLGHLGIDDESVGNRSVDVLEKVTGIDVFIDGHSHSTLEDISAITEETCKVGETLLTSTGTKFANIGAVVIADDGIATITIPTEELTVEPNAELAARAAEIAAEIEADYGAVFAKSEVDLNGERAPGNRTEETNLGDLITDAMLWLATKEELSVPAENVVAITNGGGIRAAIAAGDVSKKDVNTVLPFGNTVAVDYVTGAVLLEALEASTYCTPTAIGGFPQVAGINFTVDTRVAFAQGEAYPGTTYYAPASIGRVTINDINGKEFDPEATYAVVTNDFVAAGGDTYYALSVSDVITDTGIPLDEALMQYITEELGGVIPAEKYAEPQGRITVINPMGKFTDIQADAWYVAPITEMVNAGILEGTSETTFAPEATLTVAEIYQTLYNVAGPKAEDAAETDPWWTDAMTWAAETGIYTGEVKDFTNAEAPRSQVDEIMDLYLEKVTGSEATELFQGNQDGDMMWDKTITRAEWAQVLVRLAAVPMPIAE